MNYEWERQFENNLETAQQVIKEILSNIKTKVDEEHVFDIRIILNELITNCVIHGNKKDTKKKINLSFSLNNNKVKIIVSDEGKGLKRTKKCDPKCLYENGRGLILVEGLSDKFIIEGNTVTVHKCFN